MKDEIFIIKVNIAHYVAMLKLDMDVQRRSVIERLLSEAKADLALANGRGKIATAADGAPSR